MEIERRSTSARSFCISSFCFSFSSRFRSVSAGESVDRPMSKTKAKNRIMPMARNSANLIESSISHPFRRQLEVLDG